MEKKDLGIAMAVYEVVRGVREKRTRYADGSGGLTPNALIEYVHQPAVQDVIELMDNPQFKSDIGEVEAAASILVYAIDQFNAAIDTVDAWNDYTKDADNA